MQGLTPVEQDLRRKAAGADPDAARYADAHRIMSVAEAIPGIPFPGISRAGAAFFFAGTEDPAGAIRSAETILGYALGVTFKPRQTVAHDVRHDILTAELTSGMTVDLVGPAQYGQPSREDAAQLVTVA